MGQSLSQMYIHLVFGTKGGYPFITSEIEDKLYAYLVGAFKNLNSPILKINSMPDHIHILFRLSKNHTLAKVVEETKKQSSKWMKEQGVNKFTWQIGYGAFSVSSSKVDIVSKYIANQKEHHKVKLFKQEVEEFMKGYGVSEYDAKYFWE